MDELDIIVQNMVKAGESDEAIKLVIQSYEQGTEMPAKEPAPLKKKEATESPSNYGEATSVSGGSDTKPNVQVEDKQDRTIEFTSIEDIPMQIANEDISQLYDNYIQEGKIKPAQQKAIEDKIKAQESGDRGFWETAIAMTEGMLKTGVAVPVFQYDSEEDLIRSRELKNKIDFLSALPEETVAELKTYAGEKVTELEGENMNVLAENKILEEKGKQLVNTLKYQEGAIKELQQSGMPIPEKGVREYNKTIAEIKALSGTYNSNVDMIENNTKDLGDFYSEVNLLKKNYGGLDYYKDMTRLTTAGMMAGAGELALSTRDRITDKTGMKPLLDAPFTQEDIQEFREEVADQQDYLKPAMSVNDINSMGDFGAWLGEQVATQLPVITVLATSGGTAGLGILGISAAGQEIGELEDRRTEAKQTIQELNNVLNSGAQFSEEEIDDIEAAIAEAEGVSNISDDEMYLAGLGTGALEVLTEKVTLGILSKGKRAYLAAKKAGGESFKEFGKGVGRNVVAGMEEGGAEFINQFGGNLIDIMYLNDPDVHIFDGTLDALASGTAMGFGMRAAPSGLGMGIKAFQSKGKTAEIKAKSQMISDLLAEIEVNAETVDADTKQMLKKKANKLKKEVAKDIKKTFDDVAGRPKEVTQELINLDKSANKIAKRVQNVQKSNMDKRFKKEFLADLKKDLDKIAERKQEILDTDYGTKPETETIEGTIEDGAEGQAVQGETVEGESATTDAKRPSIEQTVRTFRVANPFGGGKPLVEIPLNESLDSSLDYATRKVVDRFFPIKKIQGAIESKLGSKLSKEQNFRQAEIAMHGKAANQMQDFANITKTLIKDTVKSDLTEVEGKSKVDRLSDYLMARHAKERNEHIRKLPLRDPDNTEVNEAGSGMTDKEADAMLNSFKGKELAAVERLAERVDTILEETRQIMLDAGLITELQKDVLTNYYKYYVPLQGFETEDLSSDMATAFGLSINVKGKETKRASGRTSKADNVLANIVGFRNSMIVRAEKNRVMQSLYEMVKQNPDPSIWKIYSKKRPDMEWGQTSGGKVGWVPANMDNSKKYASLKIKGKQYYIKFANERLAQVLDSASVEKTDLMTKTMGKFNRYLSTVLTTYNPEFMISNALRDIQAAIINQASERDISHNSLQDKTFIRATIKSTLPAIKTIYRVERGKSSNTELDKYYREFKEDGAKTDWFYAKNVDGIKKDIQKMVNAESKGKNAVSGTIDAVKAIGNWLDDGNTAVENGVRLASYMEARKAGVTREDAAEFAKELTINFNQKGELGTLANTMFLFFNASVQGTVRFGKAMTTLKKTVEDDGSVKYGLNRAQKMAAAMTAASAINTMINIASSDDDEDGVSFYDKIPDYEKERNLIIMNPWSDEGDYFKVPLPYGYNVFHNLGTIATEVSLGNREAGDGVGFMINSLVGAFNPLSMPESDSALVKTIKTIAPTILRPAIELVANESHFGSSIYNENFPVGTPKPESELGRASTNQNIVAITQWLNEVTGGSEYTSGLADVNPDKVEHMLEFLGGGTLKFINNVSKTGNYIFERANGEEVEIKAREIPFLRKVYGEPSEFISKEIYYDRKTEIDQLYDEYRSDVTGNKGKERYKGITALKNKQKASDKRLKEIRNQMKKINKIVDPIEKSKKMKAARDRETKIINNFNKRYNELRLGL